MSRNEIFIVRSKRVKRRDRQLCNPNANLNSPSIENDEIILKDIFKYALNVITRTFNSFDCGLMDFNVL